MQDSIAKPEQLTTIHTTQEIDGFITMGNTPMPEPDWTRLLDRQSYTQPTVVQGFNKQIILNDGVSDRLIIGYSKDGF